MATHLTGVYHWRLLLEELAPDIVWIKGAHNTVTDAISRLDYAPVKEHNHHWMTFTQRRNFYTYTTPADHPVYEDSMNFVFANTQEEESIYPLCVHEIAEAQNTDANLKKLTKLDKYEINLVDDTEILCKHGKLVIPKSLQQCAVEWYHHYLQHPGATLLEETLRGAIYWKGM